MSQTPQSFFFLCFTLEFCFLFFFFCMSSHLFSPFFSFFFLPIYTLSLSSIKQQDAWIPLF
ncbi:hypothetical protein BC940DRAFT_7223 [Gongronella butleri]|nr:hypothetical protein BC940DRAFT_7223 [Gongronella butleri]